MSRFTTPADLRMLDNDKWQLLAEFDFYLTGDEHAHIIVVPEGTITDLASVPRVLWAIFPPHGRYAKAAILHDYLYANAIMSKRWADDVFFQAMGVLGVPRWQRYLMYWAVRVFGKGSYQ